MASFMSEGLLRGRARSRIEMNHGQAHCIGTQSLKAPYLEDGTHHFCCDVPVILTEGVECLEVRLGKQEKASDGKTSIASSGTRGGQLCVARREGVCTKFGAQPGERAPRASRTATQVLGGNGPRRRGHTRDSTRALLSRRTQSRSGGGGVGQPVWQPDDAKRDP